FQRVEREFRAVKDEATHEDIPPRTTADFQIESELGAPVQGHSILRAEQNSVEVAVRDEENLDKAMLHEEHMTDEVPTGVSRRRLSWVDQKTSAKLESVRVFKCEAAVDDDDDSDEELAEVREDDENPEKKFLILPEEETLNDVFDDYESEEDEEDEQSPKRTYERKRKAEDISAAKKEESDEDVTENWDEYDEENLLIDDGEDEEVEVKKKKQRRSAVEIKREKMEIEMAKMEEYERLSKLLDETDDVHEQYAILMKMTLGDKAPPKFEVEPTNMEEFAKELELDLEKNAEFYEERQRKSFALIDGNRFSGERRTKKDIDREFAKILGLCEDEDDAEDKNAKKGEMETFEDIPDVDDLIHEDPKSLSHIAGQIEKKRLVEVPLEGDKKEERKKKKNSKRGYTKGAPKKDEGVARTEEEVIAEIGKKKAESLEKATRMKEMKREEKERKRVEKEKKKKKAEERVKEEKKREKKEDWMNLVERAPRTRAEASRRTKALLKLGKRVMLEVMNEDGYEDEGRKKMKKGEYEDEEEDEEESEEKEESEIEEEEEKPKQRRRTRRTRTNPVAYHRRVKDEVDDEEDDADCGNYVDNPNDIRGTKYCQSEWDSELEDEEDDEDACSAPFLWRSDKENEMMIDGAMGPANFDPDEIMKRRLNHVTEFSEGITAEYQAMIKQLDGMQLNLFADSTVRRFDPGVVHTIDSSITVCMWPVNALPKPEDTRPMQDLHVWPKEGATPFGRRGPSDKVTPFVRIRPQSIMRDKKASMEIDKMAAGGVVTVTKDDIMRNLEELLQSKLDGTKKWTPLPSARNPFDVPEISTRKLSTEPREDTPVSSYIQKVDLISLPPDNVNKKRMKKKTIKEALMEFVKNPETATDVPEDIYKDDKEEDGDDDDGYKFEWNEMGEIMDNPMRDNLVGEDPFGAHSYEEMDFGVVEEVVDEDESAMMGSTMMDIETEEETHIGEAFSFMANHLDI
ncbi:hypothetical protein PFISCL1PPCAC_786, partial [Pristionchus fissidentatus]